MHFLKQIFEYTVLHYTVNKLNLQLSTCIMLYCYVYVNTTTWSLVLASLPITQIYSVWHWDFFKI
jgi:hypothetical protein